ncbi:MAG: SRPBCC family protein [Winogradskyella sp.]|uniref:SRPBCC family protein n=1 Tax=Winogradskyella sp. TaxID=1883156 RepID=UPI0025F65C34|nr:SRPBCC family protein [Winogradskyella sp.]NRB58704.1 SRPBCC family protein [Winogradskyella sp.]
MKFSTEILIRKPLQDVIHKMNNIENKKHWQDGLYKIEHLSGNPGEFGAKIRLTYRFSGQQMEVIETITKQNFPDEFYADYASKGIRNIQENYFKSTKEGDTLWTCVNEYIPTNFLMHAMIVFMPRTYKKQARKYMANFKNFIENGTSVTHA